MFTRPKRVIFDLQVYTESTLVEQSTPVALQFQDRDLGVLAAKKSLDLRYLRETQCFISQRTAGFFLMCFRYVNLDFFL